MKSTGVWDLQEAQTGHIWSPVLAQHLAKTHFKGKNVFDIGCGNGAYTNYFNSINIPTIGVDGTEFPDSTRLVWDLAEPFPDFQIPPSAILCLEVAEHIPARWETQFLENLVKFAHEIIVLSWAIPNQGGIGHFNEQPNSYVIEKMSALGWEYDDWASQQARKEVENDPCSWFKNTILIFRK